MALLQIASTTFTGRKVSRRMSDAVMRMLGRELEIVLAVPRALSASARRTIRLPCETVKDTS